MNMNLIKTCLCILLATSACGSNAPFSEMDPSFNLADTEAGSAYLGQWRMTAVLNEEDSSCGTEILNEGDLEFFVDALGEENDTYRGNCQVALQSWPEAWQVDWPENWNSDKYDLNWPQDLEASACKVSAAGLSVVLTARSTFETCHITSWTTIALHAVTPQERIDLKLPEAVTTIGTFQRIVSPGNTCASEVKRGCSFKFGLSAAERSIENVEAQL
jgi:hypothetical protein